MPEEEQNDNMIIWDGERTPDTKFVKAVQAGRKYKTTDAQYLIMRGTMRWGPFGERWGLRNDMWDIVLQESDVHNAILVYHGDLFYPGTVQEASFPTTSCGRFFEYRAKWTPPEWQLDDEIYKKVKTNALSKGLSWLGFAADIYMGKWDDDKYLQQVKNEEAAKAAGKKPTKEPDKEADTTVDPSIKQTLDSIRKDLNDEERFTAILGMWHCTTIEDIPDKKIARLIWKHIADELKVRKEQQEKT